MEGTKMAEPLKFTLHDAQRLEPLTDLVQRLTGTHPADQAAIRERIGRLAALCGIDYQPDTIPVPPAPVIERRGEDRADSGELPHPMGIAWPTPQVKAVGTHAHDVFTHRGNWRLALIYAREFSFAVDEHGDGDDRQFWDHELRVFDATFSELTGQDTAEFTKAWAPAEQEAIRLATAARNAPQVERQRIIAAVATVLGEDVPGTLEKLLGRVANRRTLGQPPARPPEPPRNLRQEAPPPPQWGPVRIQVDAANSNNCRLYVGAGDGQQWAKVYGQDPEMAQARAIIIRDALTGAKARQADTLNDLRDALRFSPGTDWTWDQLLDGVRELNRRVDEAGQG